MAYANYTSLSIVRIAPRWAGSQRAMMSLLSLLKRQTPEPPAEPTGCATSLQQAGYVARSGCTSNLGRIINEQALWYKSHFGAEIIDAIKNSPGPLRLRFLSRCASRGQR